MYRRDFLKLSGLLSAAVFIQFNALANTASFPVEAQGKLFRSTSDGKIYMSGDAGKSWQLHTNFGSEISILELRTNFWGQVQTQLGIAGHSFKLALAHEGKIWKTV